MIKFYQELDETTTTKDAEALMKSFLILIFQLLRRNHRLGIRMLDYFGKIVPTSNDKKHLVIDKSIKYAKRRQE